MKEKTKSPSLQEMVRGSGALTLPLLDQVSGGTSWSQGELLLMRMITLFYVTDVESHRLSKFNSDGKLLKTVGGEGGRTGQFERPRGITLSKDNVCDSGNRRIQVFDTNLKSISCLGKKGSGEGEFSDPYDLTFDPAGDVYVTDWGNDRVQVFSQNGIYLRTFGRCGSGLGELSFPWGICVDHDYDCLCC